MDYFTLDKVIPQSKHSIGILVYLEVVHFELEEEGQLGLKTDRIQMDICGYE